MTKSTQAKLRLREHFILQNVKGHIPQYAGLWAAAALLAWIASFPLGLSALADYSLVKNFAASLLSISITTITFAIPTCMRTIFAAYEGYYSTTIRTILIQRFPITLLALSSFTSLGVSMLIVSGILGAYIPVDASVLFCLSTFWGLVCIYYLFMAIEKLVYFVVRAPEAILDKLEFGVSSTRLLTKEDYTEFRHQLASINDIAATIVQKSTGRDEVILRCLDALRQIHLKYATEVPKIQDPVIKKRHVNACRAVLHELTRVYREAASSKNEHAAETILEVYCDIICDAVKAGCSCSYVTEMISLFEKFQSYAFSCGVEEIQEQAATDWFFMLITRMSAFDKNRVSTTYTSSCIVRELSSSLRRITVDNRENLMLRFMKVSSNVDINIELDDIPEKWLFLLDRAILNYLTWLLEAEPLNTPVYLGYLSNYSISDGSALRSVLCDSKKRLITLLDYDNVTSSYYDQSTDSNGLTQKRQFSPDRTAVLMGISVEADVSKTLAYLIMAAKSNCRFRVLAKENRYAAKIFSSAHKIITPSVVEDEDLRRKSDLASCAAGVPLSQAL